VARAFFAYPSDEGAANLDPEVLDELVQFIQERLRFRGGLALPLQSDQDGPVGTGDDFGVEGVEGLGLRDRVGHEVRDGRSSLTARPSRAKRNFRHFAEG